MSIMASAVAAAEKTIDKIARKVKSTQAAARKAKKAKTAAQQTKEDGMKAVGEARHLERLPTQEAFESAVAAILNKPEVCEALKKLHCNRIWFWKLIDQQAVHALDKPALDAMLAKLKRPLPELDACFADGRYICISNSIEGEPSRKKHPERQVFFDEIKSFFVELRVFKSLMPAADAEIIFGARPKTATSTSTSTTGTTAPAGDAMEIDTEVAPAAVPAPSVAEPVVTAPPPPAVQVPQRAQEEEEKEEEEEEEEEEARETVYRYESTKPQFKLTESQQNVVLNNLVEMNSASSLAAFCDNAFFSPELHPVGIVQFFEKNVRDPLMSRVYNTARVAIDQTKRDALRVQLHHQSHLELKIVSAEALFLVIYSPVKVTMRLTVVKQRLAADTRTHVHVTHDIGHVMVHNQRAGVVEFTGFAVVDIQNFAGRLVLEQSSVDDLAPKDRPPVMRSQMSHVFATIPHNTVEGARTHCIQWQREQLSSLKMRTYYSVFGNEQRQTTLRDSQRGIPVTGTPMTLALANRVADVQNLVQKNMVAHERVGDDAEHIRFVSKSPAEDVNVEMRRCPYSNVCYVLVNRVPLSVSTSYVYDKSNSLVINLIAGVQSHTKDPNAAQLREQYDQLLLTCQEPSLIGETNARKMDELATALWGPLVDSFALETDLHIDVQKLRGVKRARPADEGAGNATSSETDSPVSPPLAKKRKMFTLTTPLLPAMLFSYSNLDQPATISSS